MDNSNNFGIQVTASGANVNATATSKYLVNMENPLIKLDRSNTVSFQNISIFFAIEPPTGSAGTSTTTLLYKFAHGYTYTPSFWSFSRADGVTGQFSGSTTYFVDSGLIAGVGTGFDAANAYIQVGVDQTYFYIYVTKFTNSLGNNVFLAGASLNMRVYIFAEDVGI